MYIFSKTAAIAPGKNVAGITFALEAAARVTAITGIPVGVYRMNFGAPVGTVMWSARYDSHAQLGDVEAKLYADPGYMAFVDGATDLFHPVVTDALTEVVSTTFAAPTAIVAATQAVVANGKIAEGMELGVAIQQAVAKATGMPAAFCSDVYGAYGGVRWLFGASSMEELDNGRATINADANVQALVAKAGAVYLAGSGQNGLITKLN